MGYSARTDGKICWCVDSLFRQRPADHPTGDAYRLMDAEKATSEEGGGLDRSSSPGQLEVCRPGRGAGVPACVDKIRGGTGTRWAISFPDPTVSAGRHEAPSHGRNAAGAVEMFTCRNSRSRTQSVTHFGVPGGNCVTCSPFCG